MSARVSRHAKASLLLTLAGLAGLASAAPTPPDSPIDNTAVLTFRMPSGALVRMPSNRAAMRSTLANTTIAEMSLMRWGAGAASGGTFDVAPGQCRAGGGSLATLPTSLTLPGNGPVEVDADSPLAPMEVLHAGEPVFVRILDGDHNLDAAQRETVQIVVTSPDTGDSETLLLTETGTDSGEFIGYIETTLEAGSAGDCRLQVAQAGELRVDYQDFGLASVERSVLVDPFGIVFDSLTGAPLDGATVDLINADTGLPAQVFGDDGVSTYPASVISGGSVTDSAGATYDFAPGAYRFPFLTPGNYRLVVTPPAGYLAPSQVPTAELQVLPGGPFAITHGSRGEVFVIDPGPALHIDLPVDPVSSGLFVTVDTQVGQVAAGDFLAYTVTVRNANPAAIVRDVLASVQLPPGFRLVPSSVRLDSGAGPAPFAASVSADARSLGFDIGDLPADTVWTLTFVVEVAAGAQIGPARSTTEATALGGLRSNTAFSTVTVRDDLMRTTNTLMGEVLVGACDAGTDALAGVAGVRILLEDGSFVVSDARGRFHFRGVQPGTHVVQLDKTSLPPHLEVADCGLTTRHAGRAWSQFVDLKPGTLWRTDFRLRERQALTGDLAVTLAGASDADGVVGLGIALANGDVAVEDLRLTLLLPEDAVLKEGGVQVDGQVQTDARLQDGVLSIRLGSLAAATERAVSVRLRPAAGRASLAVRALVSASSAGARNLRSEPLSLSVALPVAAEPAPAPRIEESPAQRVERITLQPRFQVRGTALDAESRSALRAAVEPLVGRRIELEVVGHTDAVPIAPQNRHEFADNAALSLARAQAVADYIAGILAIPVERIRVRGAGSSEPIADESTAAGRARNRRVDLNVAVIEEPVAQAEAAATGAPSTDATGVPAAPMPVSTRLSLVGAKPGAEIAPREELKVGSISADYAPYARKIDGDLFASVGHDAAILWPAADVVPSTPAVRFAVLHEAGHTANLLSAGRLVDRRMIGGVYMSGDGRAVTEWLGVPISEGSNAFEVVITDAGQREVTRFARQIHFSGPPARAELLVGDSRLVADGRNPIEIAVRLLDRHGRPVNAGHTERFDVAAPYAPLADEAELRERQLLATAPREATYTVGDDGIAIVRLMPTSQSGEVVLSFPFGGREARELRVWLEPEARDWVLVGLAEGTVGHRTVTDNLAAYQAQGGAPDYFEEGRVAFYAKGMVKGEYLLTAAYDTRRAAGIGAGQFGQTIDPNQYYMLYGDGAEQGHDAASSRNLYLRIERQQFVTLFGDFDSGLTYTELGRYSRRMTGLKSELHGERFGYTAFASENTQAFVKDELRGDGTSGLYRLSRRPLMINSERVYIEVRDRLHSEQVLSRRELARHTDYTIDYYGGTLSFKEAIPARDEQFNPVYLVVDYEVQGAGQEGVTAGGRAAAKFADGKVEVGATVISEGVQGAEGELYAADLRVQFSEATELKAEVATSDSDAAALSREGNAYSVAVDHRGENLSAKAYLKHQAEGFGLAQQAGSESGTRKYGVEGRYQLDTERSVEGRAYVQEQLDTGATRQVLEASTSLQAASGDWGVTGGLRHATDDYAGVEPDRVSQQVFAGGRLRMTEDIALRLSSEFGVGGERDSVDHPDRLQFGIDYKLTDKATAFVDHEYANGPRQDSQMTRFGVRTEPWAQARIDTSLAQRVDEYGPRTFAVLGLTQGWQAREDLLLDFGIERSHTLRAPGDAPFDTDVPPASGTTVAEGDYSVLRLGATWKLADLTLASRIEARRADSEDRTNLFLGALRQESEDLGYAWSFNWLDSATAAGGESRRADTRLGVSWRPNQGAWILLDRLELAYADELSLGNPASTTWKLINNLNANWKPTGKLELGLQHGLKLTRAQLDGRDYSGVTDLYGVEARYDFLPRWDVGLHAGVLHSWESDTADWGWGVSVGRDLFTNVWVSVGYNIDGYHDADFSAARWTARGPYLKFRIKFDQDSIKDLMDFERGTGGGTR